MRRRDITRATTRAAAAAAIFATGLLAAAVPADAKIGEGAKESDAERSACADWRSTADGVITTIRVCGRIVDQVFSDNPRATPYATISAERWDCAEGGSPYCTASPAERRFAEVPIDAVAIDFDAGTASVAATIDGCDISAAWTATSAATERREEDYTRPVDYQKNQVQLNKKGTYVTSSRYASADGAACGWSELVNPSTTGYIEKVVYEETYTYIDATL